ncbi:MAG: hypothetical protein ABI621_09650 [Chloroflexota bacterium]
MRRLQYSILYLLVYLTILFNIERIDVEGATVIDLATAVYVLSLLAIVMTLSIKWLRALPQSTLILLWTAIYLLMKTLLISQRPLVGGMYTYHSLAELGLFMAAVLLAKRLALHMEEFEQAVKNFAFIQMPKIRRAQEMQARIQAEIYRSRRFQRPLSIIVLETDWNSVQTNPDKVVQDGQRILTQPSISAMMINELSARLRQTDLLVEHDKKDRLIIISPDTDQTGTETLINRLKPLTQSAVFSIKFGAATFPGHALTFEQLLEHAEMNLQQRIDSRIHLGLPEKVEKDQALYAE